MEVTFDVLKFAKFISSTESSPENIFFILLTDEESK